jgi:hypothetical protein
MDFPSRVGHQFTAVVRITNIDSTGGGKTSRSEYARVSEQTAGSPALLRSVVTVLRVAAIVVVMVMVSTWLASYAGLPAPRIFVCLSIPWVVYEVWKRT